MTSQGKQVLRQEASFQVLVEMLFAFPPTPFLWLCSSLGQRADRHEASDDVVQTHPCSPVESLFRLTRRPLPHRVHPTVLRAVVGRCRESCAGERPTTPGQFLRDASWDGHLLDESRVAPGAACSIVFARSVMMVPIKATTRPTTKPKNPGVKSEPWKGCA